MSEKTQATGQCLCGKVSLSVPELSLQTHACHCSQCRTWGGGPAFSVDCGTDVSFDGESHISIFKSSEWAERGFCANCGSHLFYRLIAAKQYMVPFGLFKGGHEFVFESQIFIDEKPGFYCFADKTKEMTGAEVFAQYQGET